MTSLEGKCALVTGGSRGIGLAVAVALRAAGAEVVRLARSFDPDRHEDFTDVACDVSVERAVESAVAEVMRRGHPPDVLVNNAGSFLLKPLATTTAAEFQQQLSANLVGPFLVLRALLPHMEHRGGHVVTVGSVADHMVFAGNAAYGSSKQGLRALHDVVATEYRGKLRTTLISPGPTDTSLWDALRPDERDDVPNRSSMLAPGDVADAVLFAVTRPPRVNVDVIRLSPGGP